MTKPRVKTPIVAAVAATLAGCTVLFGASRPPVRAKHAMVVSAHELASQVGVEILQRGGNAVDAAVATGFALAVVYPAAGNLGGGGFMVIRWPDGRATTLDFREKAPRRSHRDMYLDPKGQVIQGASTLGYLASGVPGSVAGLTLALEKYGTMKLKDVLKPAIRFAEKGFPVSYQFAEDLRRHADNFRNFPASARVFLKEDQPYQEGDRFVQKDLAATLKLIAKQGRDAFYRGKIADLMAVDMAKHGGLITKEDLASYRAVERPPVLGTYRGHKLISMGPPSSGGVCLIELLNILEGYDLKGTGFNSSRTIHLLAEAMRRVYADRAQYLGDPDFVSIPVAGLISKDYAAKHRSTIDETKATPSHLVRAGTPPADEPPQTTHYSVVDENGMAVAVTTTLNDSYGSKVVVEGAGFLMNNEMDDFSLKPGHPNLYGLVGGDANAIAPGKRMLSSMTPTIVEKDGKLFMMVGTPGGSTIITTVAQVIMNVIDHRMPLQEAVDAPRVHHQWLPDQLSIEKRALPVDVIENLTRLGHNVVERDGYPGDVQAIMIEPDTKVVLGASDARGEGRAVGY